MFMKAKPLICSAQGSRAGKEELFERKLKRVHRTPFNRCGEKNHQWLVSFRRSARGMRARVKKVFLLKND